MADTNAKIDANKGIVALAVTDDVATETRPLLVDPVTGRLEIGITAVAAITSTAVSAKIDNNMEGVSQAVTDDGNLTPKPLKVNSSGELVLDLVVE
jgi:hypothetical protein